MSLYNQANPTNFILDIPDAGLTEAFRLNIQSGMIPGIRIPVSDIPAGTQGIARGHLPGSTLEFDPLVVRFLIDSELDGWIQLYKWMLSINNYVTLNSTAHKSGNSPTFVSLHILDNSKTNIVMTIHYHGPWISDLGTIDFSYTEEGSLVMTCTATINYKYFTVEKDNKIIASRLSIAESAINNGTSLTSSMM